MVHSSSMNDMHDIADKNEEIIEIDALFFYTKKFSTCALVFGVYCMVENGRMP